MKLQPIQYVVEIVSSGSISQAAKNLFTSQSNVSSSLKVLEEEVGFTIFERTKSGIKITANGRQFLTMAETIYDLTQRMTELRQMKANRTFFGVATENYSFCHEAFVKLSLQYQDRQDVDLAMLYGNKQKACDHVLNSKCEIGIILVSPMFSNLFVQNLKRQGLDSHVLRSVDLYFRLAPDHPLLDTIGPDGTFDFKSLSQYPCVDYASDDGVLHYILNDILGLSVVHDLKRINIFDRDYKKRIVSATNSWTIGVSYSSEDERDFKGTRIPVPGIAGEMLCIRREGHRLSEEAERYLSLLDQEFCAIEMLDRDQ